VTRGRCAALVAIAACLAVPAAAGAQARGQLGVADAQSGAVRVLQRARSSETSWRSLRWARNGRSLSAVRLWRSHPVSIVRDGAVVMRLNGVDQAELSPDGARAAELRVGEDGVTLTVRDLATRRRQAGRRLAGRDPSSRPLARWSPDGKRLAVAWEPATARWRLVILDVATLRSVRVLSGRGGLELAQGAWSPDGHRLVYGVEQERQLPVPLDVDLRVLDVAAPDTRRLARPHVWLGDAAWSPAGDRIAMSYDFDAVGLVAGAGGLMSTIDLPGDDELHALAWAPDAASLALLHSPDFESDLRLSVLDVAGRRLRVLHTLGPGEGNEVAWSPDGAWIAYAVRDG
jgi:dipeptidyl aminopeptidase/acylaminoacyl peptidase